MVVCARPRTIIHEVCHDMRVGLRVQRLTVVLLAKDQLLPLGKALLSQNECRDLGDSFLVAYIYEKPSMRRPKMLLPLCVFWESSDRFEILRLYSGSQKPVDYTYTGGASFACLCCVECKAQGSLSFWF